MVTNSFLLQRMLENKELTADVPQAVFQLLSSLMGQSYPEVQSFMDKFIKSGGLILSINLKHWSVLWFTLIVLDET